MRGQRAGVAADTDATCPFGDGVARPLAMFTFCSRLRDMSAMASGRGTATNAPGRFEPYAREPVDDGWWPADLAPLRTEVSEERPRSVITAVDSPDLPFRRSVNPYRGCEHGCAYCYARPTHAHLGLSPGLDFETRLVARPLAPQVLARELGRPSYVPEVIALGTNTDPYQPIERDRRITRGLLAVLAEHGHPVMVTTKGALVERDLDVLAPMAARGLAQVGISVTTLDPALSRVPRAPRAGARAAPPRSPAAERGGRAGTRPRGARHPGADRPRSGGDPGRGGRGGRGGGEPHAPAPARRGGGALRRLAGAARPGARGPRHGPDARDARGGASTTRRSGRA
jgi:hypothetical protein